MSSCRRDVRRGRDFRRDGRLGVEIKLETHELNEYSKTRLNLAQTRTLMSQAKLTFLAR
jgi:hypothetical protein